MNATEQELLALIEQCEQLAYKLNLLKSAHKINDAKNAIGWEMAATKEAHSKLTEIWIKEEV